MGRAKVMKVIWCQPKLRTTYKGGCFWRWNCLFREEEEKYFSCISKAVFLAENKDVYFVINFNFFFGKKRRTKSVICLFQVFLKGIWFWILWIFGIMSSTYYIIIANLLEFGKIFNFVTFDEWLDWIEKKHQMPFQKQPLVELIHRAELSKIW